MPQKSIDTFIEEIDSKPVKKIMLQTKPMFVQSIAYGLVIYWT